MIKFSIHERLHEYDYDRDLVYIETREHFINRVVNEMNKFEKDGLKVISTNHINNKTEKETFIIFYRKEE